MCTVMKIAKRSCQQSKGLRKNFFFLNIVSIKSVGLINANLDISVKAGFNRDNFDYYLLLHVLWCPMVNVWLVFFTFYTV